MAINRAVLTGNLTRDPELRQTANGGCVLSMGLAVNDRRKDPQTGEWEDYPNFVDCTMFGNRAQAVAPYLAKGSKVAVEGKLRYSSWEKDGQKRSKLEVVVDEIEFMSRGDAGQQGYQQQQAYGQQAYQQGAVQRAVADAQPVYDQDVAF